MRLGDCHPRPGEWGSPRWTAAGGRGGQLRVNRCSGPDRPRGQRRSAWAASPVCLGKLPEPSFHGGAGLWGGRWHRPSVSARACGRDGRAWRRAGTQRPRPAAGPCEGRCGGRPLREARRGGGPGRGAIPARARVSVGVLVRGGRGRGLGPRAPLATVGMSREVLASRVLRTGRGAQKRGSVPHDPGVGLGQAWGWCDSVTWHSGGPSDLPPHSPPRSRGPR